MVEKKYNNLHILISQLRLHDYAGSEMVVLELVEYLVSQGARVTIVTFSYGEPIFKQFDCIKNVRLFSYSSQELEEALSQDPVDVAWIHHQMIPEFLLRNPSRTKFIFHHMSPYSNIEAPIFWRIENSLADAILCNSRETRDEWVSKKLLSDTDDRVEVFNNPAPAKFFGRKNSQNSLRSLLVVSNHIPDELERALQEVEKKGVKVTVFGAHNDTYKRVLPEDIKEYDAVVSIGKTVQYALLARRPVYCYDRFGGPGYLSDSNYNKAKNLNFSGRGFRKKTPEVIASELIDHFSDANKYSGMMSKAHLDRYNLESRIDDTFGSIKRQEKSKPSINSSDIESYLLLMPLILNGISGSAHQKEKDAKATREKINAYRDKIHTLKSLNIDYHNENTRLNKLVDDMTHSVSYRLGNVFATPVRRVKNIFRAPSASEDDILTKYYTGHGRSDGIKLTLVLKNSQGPSSSAFIRLISPLLSCGKYTISIVDGNNYQTIAKDTDACIVQRVALESRQDAEAFVEILKKNKIPLITDTDDAFCNISKDHPEYEDISRRSEALIYLMKCAEVNLYSTQSLKDLYKSHIERDDGVVVINTLDEKLVNRWSERSTVTSKDEALQILYMGTPTHGGDFKIIEQALDEIYTERPGSFVLNVMGVARDIESSEWINILNPTDIVYPGFMTWFSGQGPFDIGISPLVEDGFNAHKSDIKCLDYLSVGAYPVVSNVKAYANPDLDGLITRVENKNTHWKEIFEQLIDNKEELRHNKKRILDGYDYLTTQRSSKRAGTTLEHIISSTLERKNL